MQYDFEFLPFYIKSLPLILTFTVFFLSIIIYSNKNYLFNLKVVSLIPYSFYFLERIFLKYSQIRLGFDKFYNYGISLKVLNYSFLDLYRLLDGGLLAVLGPNGFSFLFNILNKKITGIQKGYILFYMQLFSVISLILLCCLIFII